MSPVCLERRVTTQRTIPQSARLATQQPDAGRSDVGPVSFCRSIGLDGWVQPANSYWHGNRVAKIGFQVPNSFIGLGMPAPTLRQRRREAARFRAAIRAVVACLVGEFSYFTRFETPAV